MSSGRRPASPRSIRGLTRASLQADVDRARQTVGKALGGGVLRKEDEDKYKKILATLNDTPETAVYKSTPSSAASRATSRITSRSRPRRGIPTYRSRLRRRRTLRAKYNY